MATRVSRKKSINDLMTQGNRLMENLWNQPNSERKTARMKRVSEAFGKYVDNIVATPTYKKGVIQRDNAEYREFNVRKADTIQEGMNSRKYSNSTYMGLSQG